MNKYFKKLLNIEEPLFVSFIYYDKQMLEIRKTNNTNSFNLLFLYQTLKKHFNQIYIANIELLYSYGSQFIYHQDKITTDEIALNTIVIDYENENISKYDVCKYINNILNSDNNSDILIKSAHKI